MEVQKKQKPVSKKKQARRLIYEKLAAALQEYKVHFKDKKFENNLKRASRLFANDLAKSTKKDKVKGKSKKGEPKAGKAVLHPTNGVS